MAHLQIYVAQGCPICAHSRVLAAEITKRYPGALVEVIEISSVAESALPDTVFATPTWLWDGRLFSLGNPEPGRLWQRLDDWLSSTALPSEKDNYHGRENAPSFDDGAVSGSVGKGA